MKLFQIKSNNRNKKSKRLGRGSSSGKGRNAGRGTKGQKSRSGYNLPNRFEGGQTSLIQKLAKKGGFKSRYAKPAVINLDILEKKFNDGEIISPKTLFKKNLISSVRVKVKILAKGKLTKTLKFHDCLFSQSVKNKIQKITK